MLLSVVAVGRSAAKVLQVLDGWWLVTEFRAGNCTLRDTKPLTRNLKLLLRWWQQRDYKIALGISSLLHKMRLEVTTCTNPR